MLPLRMIIDRIGRHFSRADYTHGRGRRLQMITPRGRWTRRRRRPRQPCHLRGTGAWRPLLLVVFLGLATAPRRSRRWGRPRRPGGGLLLLLRGPAALLPLRHGQADAPGRVRGGGGLHGRAFHLVCSTRSPPLDGCWHLFSACTSIGGKAGSVISEMGLLVPEFVWTSISSPSLGPGGAVTSTESTVVLPPPSPSSSPPPSIPPSPFDSLWAEDRTAPPPLLPQPRAGRRGGARSSDAGIVRPDTTDVSFAEF